MEKQRKASPRPEANSRRVPTETKLKAKPEPRTGATLTASPPENRKPPAESPSAESQGAASVPPLSLSDIPGLGPIRVRALQKAGLSSLRSVKAATLEQLLAVPGMSEIKARHIQQFLAPFETLPDLPPIAEPTPRLQKRQGIALYAPGMEMVAQSENIALGTNLVPTIARALRLLVSDHAPDYRARLLRELIRFLRRAELAQEKANGVPERERERLLRRLGRVAELLAQAEAKPELDRKAQTRLADELAEASSRLATLLGIADTPLRLDDNDA